MANQSGLKTLAQIRGEIAQEILGTADFSTETRPTLAMANITINESYREVCSSSDWMWLILEKTFNTVIGQITPYDVDPSAKSVLYMQIRGVQTKLRYMPYSAWVIRYPGAFTNYGNTLPTLYIPAPFSTTNKSALSFYLFGPADSIYTVNYGMEVGAPTELTDADNPIIPVPWQDLLRLKSLVKVYEFLGEGSRQRMLDRAGHYNELWQRAWMEDQRVKESSNTYRDLLAESAASRTLDPNWNYFGRF